MPILFDFLRKARRLDEGGAKAQNALQHVVDVVDVRQVPPGTGHPTCLLRYSSHVDSSLQGLD